MNVLFFYLLAFSSENIPYLDEVQFNEKVLNCKKNEAWAILFYYPKLNQKNREIETNFRKLISKSYGMKFSYINCSEYENFCKTSLNGHQLPGVKFYNSERSDIFTGDLNNRSFLKQAQSFIPNLVEPITLKWKEMSTPRVMLFKDAKYAPAFWKGIAAHYYGRNINIGFSNDARILFAFGYSKMPIILFSTGTQSIKYNGNYKYSQIIDAIDEFFTKVISNDQLDIGSGFTSPKFFSNLCFESRSLCVLIRSPSIKPEYEALKKLFDKSKINWFLGVKDIPFEFMKKGDDSWIYNPRKDGFISCDFKSLRDQLELVMNGEGKWSSRKQLEGKDSMDEKDL